MSGLRLAAVDLDGTLLRSDRTISPRTRAVVDRARAAGVAVVFVTARHPAAIERFVADLALTGEAVCCVGAAVCELPSAKVTWNSALAPETCREVARRIADDFPELHLGWVPVSGALGYQHGYPNRLLIGDAYHGDPRQIDVPVLKMWLVGPGLDERYPDRIAASLAGLAEIAHHGTGFVDLVAPGVNKVETLRWLCGARGIDAEQVVAFGDAEADLPMLDWAGHGVLMANARPELHARADEVAPGCDDDGVAVVLERLLDEEIRS